jgi:phytoene synthase
MQLTNIARDVGEDARNGRIYLPLDRLRYYGVDVEAWIAEPTFNAGIRRILFELLDAADSLYQRAEWGICQLPARVRPAMFAARSIYAEIGREIERRHYDSVSQRAVVSGRRKLRLLGRSLRKAVVHRQKDYAPTLDETRFLVDAVTQNV